MEVQHCTALIVHFGRRHPLIDHGAEFCHLHQGGRGHAARVHIFLDQSQLGLRGIVVVFHALDAAQHFGKIERLDRNALRFENLLAVADRVEGRGTRADRSHSQVAEAIDDPTDRGEPLQVFGELGRVRDSRYAAW